MLKSHFFQMTTNQQFKRKIVEKNDISFYSLHFLTLHSKTVC